MRIKEPDAQIASPAPAAALAERIKINLVVAAKKRGCSVDDLLVMAQQGLIEAYAALRPFIAEGRDYAGRPIPAAPSFRAGQGSVKYTTLLPGEIERLRCHSCLEVRLWRDEGYEDGINIPQLGSEPIFFFLTVPQTISIDDIWLDAGEPNELLPQFSESRAGSDASIVEILRDSARRLLWAAPELGRKWESYDYPAAFITDELREIWHRCAQKRDEQEAYAACEGVVLDVWRRAEPFEKIPTSYDEGISAAGLKNIATPPREGSQAQTGTPAALAIGIGWKLKKQQRIRDPLARMLYDVLKIAHSSGGAPPKARDAMEAIAAKRPLDFVVLNDEDIVILDSNGKTDAATTNQIRARINRMIER